MSVNYDPEVRIANNIIALHDYSGDVVYINEKQYDSLVLDLEAKARELWPHKFQPRTLNDWHKEFVNVEQDDGETDTITAEEARRLDLRIRQQQIPINSKKP